MESEFLHYPKNGNLDATDAVRGTKNNYSKA